MMLAMPTALVLTRQSDSYSAFRFMEAAKRHSLPLELLDPHLLYLYVIDGQSQVALNGRALDAAELRVIPRLGSTATEYSLAALELLEQAGARSLNPSSALFAMRNKFIALAALSAAGIPVPESAMLRAPCDIAPVIERLGGYPVVLKFIRGSQGVGVIYAPDETAVTSVLEAMNLIQYDVLVQRYYPWAAQRDVRVLVLGGEARWAVERVSGGGRFRSNFHRGGQAGAVELPVEAVELAVRAAGVFRLGLAGVDLIESPGGLLVMEVNSSPGFETIETVHSVDVAAEILRFALSG